MSTIEHAWRVCAFGHDHPVSDRFDNYDDCQAAYADLVTRQQELNQRQFRCTTDGCDFATDQHGLAFDHVKQTGHDVAERCSCGHDANAEHAVDSAGLRYCQKCWTPCQERKLNP